MLTINDSNSRIYIFTFIALLKVALAFSFRQSNIFSETSPIKEMLISHIKALHSRLQRCRIDFLKPRFLPLQLRQFFILFEAIRGCFPFSICPDPFFKEKIVNESICSEILLNQFPLRDVWINPEPIRHLKFHLQSPSLKKSKPQG